VTPSRLFDWARRGHDRPAAVSDSRAYLAVCGAIGGVTGAACMTVVRTLAQQAGLISRTVPQTIEEWASERLDWEPPGGPAGHHVVDQLAHLGYGLACGLLYGALLGRKPILAVGVPFGIAVWAAGFLGFIPALGVHRSAAEATFAENAVNIGAHALYGGVVALMTEELAGQTDRGPVPRAIRHSRSVG
jgi:hypothetical protein